MWNLKCTIIPVIIGATGIETRSLRKNLEAVPGKHSIDSPQKTAIRTCNITHNTENTAVWSLKPERWGSPLVEEKYQEEMTCDKRRNNNNNNNNNNTFYADTKKQMAWLIYCPENLLCNNYPN